jgi:pyruvate-formate lyase-activating enzyme
MKIALFDCDNKKPNLALMKLSAYYKQQGCETFLNPWENIQNMDKVFASCVFPQNAHVAYLLQEKAGAEIGGSGVDMHIKLSDEIEHTCPDYDLYGIDYSLGFTSRGCSRKCSFCIVPEKEGGIVEHSPLSEFVRHKKVVLQDNNFLASPLWREKLEEMIDRDLRVDFNQGLDIRLLTEESAELLAKVNLLDKLRFAWDNTNLECDIIRGINLLRKAGFPVSRNRLSFYILCNYNTTFEQDMWRVQTLHHLNIATFVQMYGTPTMRQKDFQRWANMPGCWRSFSFDKWLEIRNQKKHGIDKNDLPRWEDAV